MYVKGVKSIIGIVNRKAGGALIAFRSYRKLAVPTALIAWFGGEEWRCGFPGGANVVSERAEECADDVGPLGRIGGCADLSGGTLTGMQSSITVLMFAGN